MARFFFIFVGGFALGIALRSLQDIGPTFSFFLIFLGVVLFIYCFARIRTNKRAAAAGIVALFILSLGLGVFRYDIADLHQGSPILDARIGEEVVLTGIVADEEDVRETHTKLSFLVETHTDHAYENEEEIKRKTKVLVITKHFPEFQYGNRVRVKGVLQKPRNFTGSSEASRPFNYVAWLAKDGIFYQMFYPEVEFLAAGEGNPVKHTLFAIKTSLLENVSRVIPEPHAALWGGITLGTKRALGSELLQKFRDTGIIHIVVLSGYNVTIVAEAVGRAASFLPRFVGISLATSVIPLFALMTGAGATVVRASIMALLVLLARMTGRLYEITIALFAAGFLMLLWNPKILLFDPSFQLSFLATVGLLYVAPLIEKFLGWVPTRWQIREFMTATIATQLFILPLLIYMMGEVSLVSIPVNVLILAFIPYTMLFGFLTSLFASLHELLSLPFAYLSYGLLEYELTVVELFSSVPYAALAIPYLPLWVLIAWYALYAYVIYTCSSRIPWGREKNMF